MYEERLRVLAYRRLRGDLIQTYKVMHEINDVAKESLFGLASHTSATRGHSFKIKKQHTRLKLREHSFSIRVVNNM